MMGYGELGTGTSLRTPYQQNPWISAAAGGAEAALPWIANWRRLPTQTARPSRTVSGGYRLPRMGNVA